MGHRRWAGGRSPACAGQTGRVSGQGPARPAPAHHIKGITGGLACQGVEVAADDDGQLPGSCGQAACLPRGRRRTRLSGACLRCWCRRRCWCSRRRRCRRCCAGRWRPRPWLAARLCKARQLLAQDGRLRQLDVGVLWVPPARRMARPGRPLRVTAQLRCARPGTQAHFQGGDAGGGGGGAPHHRWVLQTTTDRPLGLWSRHARQAPSLLSLRKPAKPVSAAAGQAPAA